MPLKHRASDVDAENLSASMGANLTPAFNKVVEAAQEANAVTLLQEALALVIEERENPTPRTADRLALLPDMRLIVEAESNAWIGHALTAIYNASFDEPNALLAAEELIKQAIASVQA